MGNKKGFVLASVYDKKGIVDFVKMLKALGYEIISTEGTGEELAKNGIATIPAREVSKNPRKLEDCIKTISFHIEAGILFDRSNDLHKKEVKELSIKPIDIVVCNFPPLEQVIKTPKDFNIRNIDVGGPLMVRAAAANFKDVLIIVDVRDYRKVANAILSRRITEEFRRKLALKAFKYTHSYDLKIYKYLQKLRRK